MLNHLARRTRIPTGLELTLMKQCMMGRLDQFHSPWNVFISSLDQCLIAFVLACLRRSDSEAARQSALPNPPPFYYRAAERLEQAPILRCLAYCSAITLLLFLYKDLVKFSLSELH